MTVQPTRDQLRALANAATEGPWEVDDDNVYKAGRDGYGVAYDSTGENAAFIAAARNALPQLLDQLDQAEARIQAVRDVHRKETRDGIDVCEHCDLLGDRLYSGGVWPCDTIRALEGLP